MRQPGEALPAGLALVPPRRGRLPARLPATEAWLTALTGSDGRFDADPGELSALARALAPWEDIGTGKTGPARATFRLAEVTAEPDDVLFGARDDEPAGARGAGGRGRRCAGPRRGARAGLAAGVPAPVHRRPEPADPGRADLGRRRHPEPLAAPPAGVAARRTGPGQPDLPRTGGRPAPGPAVRPGPGRRRRLPLPVHGRPGTGRGRVRGPAAVLVGPPRQARAHHVRAHPGRRRGGQAGQVRQGPAHGLPVAARGRRRHAQRGGDRRARPDQGPAGPAARPVGGGGPRPAQARPGVPRAEQGRADLRRGDPPPGRRPSRGLGHPAAGHRDPGRRLGRRVAGWLRFGHRAFYPCAGRLSTPSCGPTRSGGFPGWPSFPRSASARAWPTTWGWARPCSCSRWRRCTAPSARTTRRRCCCARCRWSATGSGRRRGSRPRCACTPITGGSGCARGNWPAGWRRRTSSSPRTPPRPGTSRNWPVTSGGGSCSTRPRR